LPGGIPSHRLFLWLPLLSLVGIGLTIFSIPFVGVAESMRVLGMLISFYGILEMITGFSYRDYKDLEVMRPGPVT
jgi:uncharacterized membrane protein HdeD (DUF308 family)